MSDTMGVGDFIPWEGGCMLIGRATAVLVQIVTLAREAGFRDARHVSAADLAQRYFAGRPDGLRPPNNAEELLVAST